MLPFKKRKENHPPDPPDPPEPPEPPESPEPPELGSVPRADNSMLNDAGRSKTGPLPVCKNSERAGRIQEYIRWNVKCQDFICDRICPCWAQETAG